MQPTDEQLAILEQAKGQGNLMVNALAGSGKSTTLRMIERASPKKPILYLAFNKRVVDEIEYRAKADADCAERRMLSTTSVRTFNSIGHRIWTQACAKPLALNVKKSPDLLRALIDETPRAAQGPIWDSFWSVVQGVALAKALGYIPNGKFPNAKRLITRTDFHASLDEDPDDLTADLIDTILTRSIQAAYQGAVDYNDQVYMPALFGGTYPQFPIVLVDEYQDLNPTNHALLERLVKHRLIGVGDPWQNIYAFRGAKRGGMAEAVSRYEMTECDLSISFRCPRAIVEASRWRVPHFKWIKEGGHVEALQTLQVDDIPDGCVFICRNNAPLFKLGFQLIGSGRSVQIAGSDVGPKLVGILRKLGPESLSQAQTIDAIGQWLAERIDRGSKTAQDLADCMKVFASHGSTLGTAIAYAEHLFAQKGTIRLLTGHKAKGLEFPIVYHLDPWLLKEDEQDLNLRYVITTRSMDRYFEIDSRDIRPH